VVHDHEAVAQLLGLVHVVRGEDEGDAALLEAEETIPDDVPRLRVEAGRGLVEDEDLGLVDEAAGDREAPLHAARQRVDHVVGALGELHEVEQLIGPLGDELAPEPEVAPVHQQVLADGELGVERVFLRDHAETGPDRGAVAHGVTAENGKLTLRRRRDAAEHAHRGGLSGAVRAKEAKSLTGEQIEIDSVYRGEAAEPLRESSGADKYFRHRRKNTWVLGGFRTVFGPPAG
jgi:hypothetical protein